MKNLYDFTLLLCLICSTLTLQAQRSPKISPELMQLKTAESSTPPDKLNTAPDMVTPQGMKPPSKARQQTGATAKPDVSNFRKEGVMVMDGYVVIEAIAREDTRLLMEELKALGLIRGAAYGGMVSGLMPVEAITQMENVRSLRYVRAAHKPVTNIGEVSSQGDAAMMSDMAKSAFKVTGYGNKIGVLSDSYDVLGGAGAGIGSGDIPGASNPNGYFDEVENLSDLPPNEGSDEGRAMVEIIHDVAPGAKLAFNTAFLGQAAFAQGIIDLWDAGSNIIVDDIGYFDEPFFQDGVIAQAVDVVTHEGAAYFSSAGNADRESYQDAFISSVEATLPLEIEFGGQVFVFEEEYTFHDFDPGAGVDIFQEITIPTGPQAFAYSLQWDQPFASVCAGCPGATTDLDFFIAFEEDLDAIFYPVSSFNLNIDNDAVEAINLSNSGPPVKAYLVIGKNLTQGPDSPDPSLIKSVQFGNATTEEYLNNKSTSIGHSNAEGAIGTGASAWFNTPTFNPNVAEPIINGFSSAGGTPILFDLEGKRLAEPNIRMQPVVTGPDGANTTFFGFDLTFPVPGTAEPDGFPNFFGTSASAPHVAAVVALMNESAGEYLMPSKIREILAATAIDMDDPFTADFDEGFDFKTGYGFVNATEAIATVFPLPSVTGFTVINATTGETIGKLGERLELSQIEGGYINIQADVNPGTSEIGSVIFALTGPEERDQEQNHAPYSLFPEEGEGWQPELGEYTLTAIPYTNLSGEGEAGVPLTITFEVTRFPIASLTLVNAKSGEDIAPLMDGDEVNLLTYHRINVRANTEFEDEIGSVAFWVNGELSRIENVAPYYLAGDFNGKVLPWNAKAGDYTIVAVPYAGPDASGMEGSPLPVDISLVRELEVLQLVLIDAETDTELGALSDGDVLKLEELPPINIMAKVNAPQTQSVQFKVNGIVKNIDSSKPFALGKEMRSDFYPLDLLPGDYTIMATPYQRKGGLGEAGIPLSLEITVEKNLAIESFTLINPFADTDVKELADGDEIDEPFNIRANVNSEDIESVGFWLNGDQYNIENVAPYAMGQDNAGNYQPIHLDPGNYTLEAIPYTMDDLSGLPGVTATLEFTIVGDDADPAARMIAFPNPVVNSKVSIATQSLRDPIVAYTLVNKIGQVVDKQHLEESNRFEVDLHQYAGDIQSSELFFLQVVSKSGKLTTIRLMKE